MADAYNVDNLLIELINVQNRRYKYSLRDNIGQGSFGTVYKGIKDNGVSP